VKSISISIIPGQVPIERDLLEERQTRIDLAIAIDLNKLYRYHMTPTILLNIAPVIS
jgi:hypothetical protein